MRTDSQRKTIRFWLLTGTVSACVIANVAVPALAQTAASSATSSAAEAPPGDKTAKPKSETTTTVTVTGKKTQNRIDRQVYDVTKNADAQTGTAADALNKVPGVTVDPSGNVSLHGKNAVVYLNGRPSLMLSGDNRGAALRSMPSAYISSIEVISNPGAQYASGSSGPIINIVTKRDMPPGYFGNLGIQWRAEGGGLGMAFLSASKGKLSLTLSASANASRNTSRSGSGNTSLDSTGAVTQASDYTGQSRSTYSGPFVMANLQYDMDTDNVLAGALQYFQGEGDFTSLSRTQSRGADGKPVNVFDSSGTGRFSSDNGGLAINYTHYGKKPDETLKIDANLEQSSSGNTSRNGNTYLFSDIAANTGTRVEANDGYNHEHKASLHTEYNTPVGDDQLTLGGEINADDKRAESRAFGPDALGSALTVNSLLTDDFHSHQLVSALYGTYQRELTAKWTVLAGLRGEATDLTSDDRTYHVQGKANYVRVNPSVFATYVLTATQKLRFSYSHRQSLPDASDLNPHIVYSSDTSVNAGNPGLKPQETDSFEVRYEYDGKSLNYALRGFYHRDYRTIVPVSHVVPDPQNFGNFVTETMHVNWRHQTADGMTATVSKQIAGKLMLNADTTVTFDDIRNPLVAGVQSGTSVDGSVSLNYFMSKGDQLFLMYKLTGKQFTGQGYTTGSGWGTLQYNHKLTSKLDLTMSVSDPFRQTKTQTVIDTPLLHTRYVNSRQAPTFMIGINRRFSHFGPMPMAGKTQ